VNVTTRQSLKTIFQKSFSDFIGFIVVFGTSTAVCSDKKIEQKNFKELLK